MITFSLLGKKGNLGNALFQIASTIGIGEMTGQEYYFPQWKHSEDFNLPYKTLHGREVKEPHYHHAAGYWQQHIKDGNYSINGWLQSEKYWLDCKEKVMQALQFNSETVTTTQEKYKEALAKPCIAISIRRGDYVGNPNYVLLPVSYYYLALLEHFPDWQNYNIIIFTDDFDYAKHHFSCLPNVFFAEDGPVAQLCLGTMCQHFIIANSTFSWWMAYLGEKENTKVIRPNYLFAGPLLQKSSDQDFWPERWNIYDHADKKYDLSDTTFTIPVFHDSPHRKQNLDLSVCHLQKHFTTKIIIGEQGSKSFGYMSAWAKYVRFDFKEFHRTKMLNDMAAMCDTEIIVNYDCDVFLPPLQTILSVLKLRSGEAQVVYPFDGRCARVPRYHHQQLEREIDTGIFGLTEFKGMTCKCKASVGCCVFFDKDSFFFGGMENEIMISFGPEDKERFERFTRLGYKVARIKGCVYHLDHQVLVNSSTANPYFKANWEEMKKIREMTDEQLIAYVDTWSWVQRYTPSYYESIKEESIRSRDEVFKIIQTQKIKTVIDIGCGIGEWGYDIEKFGVDKYIGVDFKIPKYKLMIPKENYIEYDLTSNKPFPVTEKFDLAMCLEVLEHIPAENAASAVALICGLSDTILFSAAIPYQGGRNHINEQWQPYWVELFKKHGFYPHIIESIRDNKNIAVWYRQNCLLFNKFKSDTEIKPFVLPGMYENILKTKNG